jgi:hypothetical protein
MRPLTDQSNHIVYWLNTKKFCGSVGVKKGIIISSDTAPCYKWMIGKNFFVMITYLKTKGMFRTFKKLDDL